MVCLFLELVLSRHRIHGGVGPLGPFKQLSHSYSITLQTGFVLTLDAACP